MPKKFFHTAGNVREHHEDLVRVTWSHPVNLDLVGGVRDHRIAATAVRPPAR